MRTYFYYAHFGNKNNYYRLIFAFFSLLLLHGSTTVLGQESDANLCELYLQKAAAATQMDSSVYYAKQAVWHAKQTSNDSLMMVAYHALARAEVFSGERYAEGFAHGDSSYRMSEMQKDTLMMYKNLKVMGIASSLQSDPNSAHEYFTKSLDLARAMQDTLLMASSYNAIGKAAMYRFEDADENEESKSFFLKALEYYRLKKAPPSNLLVVYRNLSEASTDQEEKDMYFQKAMQIARENNMEYQLADLLMIKGRQELFAGNFDSTVHFASQSLVLTEKLGMRTHSTGNLLYMIDSYKAMDKWDDALRYLHMFDSLYDYHLMPPSNREYYYNVSTSVLSHFGNLERAYALAREMIALQDSISEAELYEQQTRYIQEFEAEQKEAEIARKELELAESKSEKNQMIFGGITLFLLAAGGFQRFSHRQKRKKERIEQELKKEQELNQVRTEFLENIAHEIRTPITLVNGYLKLALQHNTDNVQVEKSIHSALISSDRVLKNANEILELLRFDHSKISVQESDIALHRFLKRVFYSFESLAEIKRIDLQFSSKILDDTIIRTDTGKLEKILNNFISNAIKYSPSDKPIQFSAELNQRQLTVRVKDFGPGIKKDEQEKIFKRFYQASNTSNIGGVGIGLALAQKLAHALNGKITVESDENKGATFVLEMPVAEVKTAPAEMDYTEGTKTILPDFDTGSEKPKILIVEDNPEMSEYLKTILCPYFTCDIAFDGEEGLQKVQTKKYGLIISDVMMPRMDGFKFKQSINSLVNYKNVPFVFITAKAQLTDKIEGFNLGVDDYITKPFQKEELLVRIQTLLKNKRERELWVKDNLDFVDQNEGAVEQIMNKVKRCINENIANEAFRVSDLANEIGFSQRQLARLIKKAVGLSPVRFILEMRLQKAYLYLANKQFATLSEVRHHVGISSRPYFNKKFYERFGIKPSDVKA